jgi:uncharacterized protein YqjF (DUF2071 family)
MDWEDLLFLHWALAPEQVAPHLPRGLELETFEGRAWLGVVPFRMARTRWRCLPPLPGACAFPELNVRTYVRAGGKSGVWFFSLDAASRLAVAGARTSFGLPYFHARMSCERADDEVVYASERDDPRGPPAAFAARWRAREAPWEARTRPLERFLTERYALFALRGGRLRLGEIAHGPWLVARADVALERCAMTALLGFELEGPPVSALTAELQRVVAWRPTPV